MANWPLEIYQYIFVRRLYSSLGQSDINIGVLVVQPTSLSLQTTLSVRFSRLREVRFVCSEKAYIDEIPSGMAFPIISSLKWSDGAPTIVLDNVVLDGPARCDVAKKRLDEAVKLRSTSNSS